VGEKSFSPRHCGRALNLLLLVAVLFPLTTCDVFKAGLGPKIDVAAPNVSVKSLVNGALSGVSLISRVLPLTTLACSPLGSR